MLTVLSGLVWDTIIAYLPPYRWTALRSRKTKRTYLKNHTVTFAGAFRPNVSSATLTGFLHLDSTSLTFSLSPDGKLQRAHVMLSQCETYSAQPNTTHRKSETIMPVMRFYFVLRLESPTSTMDLAYDPAYHPTVRYVLDAAGLRDLSPHQDGPGATK